MATIFFPACKVMAKYPEISVKLHEYLEVRFENLQIAGCCKGKDALPSITSEDTVIYACTMCAMFFNDSTEAKEVISVWEIIDADTSFVFPNHRGRTMTIQDCWRLPHETNLHNAIRNLLKKVDVEMIELENNRDRSDFCGSFLYNSEAKKYADWSTRIADYQHHLFQSYTEEEVIEKMRNHANLITTDEVVCYCGACRDGLIIGEKSVCHLIELVF